eukprot:RCo010221
MSSDFSSDFRLFITTPALLVVCVLSIWIGVLLFVIPTQKHCIIVNEGGIVSVPRKGFLIHGVAVSPLVDADYKAAELWEQYPSPFGTMWYADPDELSSGLAGKAHGTTSGRSGNRSHSLLRQCYCPHFQRQATRNTAVPTSDSPQKGSGARYRAPKLLVFPDGAGGTSLATSESHLYNLRQDPTRPLPVSEVYYVNDGATLQFRGQRVSQGSLNGSASVTVTAAGHRGSVCVPLPGSSAHRGTHGTDFTTLSTGVFQWSCNISRQCLIRVQYQNLKWVQITLHNFHYGSDSRPLCSGACVLKVSSSWGASERSVLVVSR